jgi:hypothetical protein
MGPPFDGVAATSPKLNSTAEKLLFAGNIVLPLMILVLVEHTCASSAQIKIIDFPRDHAEIIELSMLWHSRVHDDPGSLWLRALIREAVNLSSVGMQPRGSVKRTSASASAGKKAKKVPARTGSYRANRVAGKLGSQLLMKQFYNAPDK